MGSGEAENIVPIKQPSRSCGSCRHWSEHLVKIEDGVLVARCLERESPDTGRYTRAEHACMRWADAPFGAIDDPDHEGLAPYAVPPANVADQPTAYEILIPGVPARTASAALARKPSLSAIKQIVSPVIGPAIEHVSVYLLEGPASMFVDENGHAKGLTRNGPATAFYRRWTLMQAPKRHPEDLPWIAGPAVLFHRRVWF